MARYSYPICDSETEDILSVATAASNAASLISDYAERKSNTFGKHEYELDRDPDEIIDELSDRKRVRVGLLAYNGHERDEDGDEELIVERMEVNTPLEKA